MQKRLYESMERHLDAAIEKVESLARDNQQGKQQKPLKHIRIAENRILLREKAYRKICRKRV